MKKLLVVGLCLLSILSLSACNKEDESTPTVEPNYAINDVKDPTEEEIDETTSTTESTESSTSENIESEEIIINKPSDTIYNVDQDAHATDIYDMSTISIDGKLIGFPCDYQYVTSIFGQLNTIEYNSKTGDVYLPIDETISAKFFEVYAIPTTGEGLIKFTFRSKTDQPSIITDMICHEVYVSGGNTTGNKVMTFALPQFITFGSTFDEILAVYNVENATHYESSNNSTDFRIRYVFEDLHQCYDFIGYDNGLYTVIINYNYSN